MLSLNRSSVYFVDGLSNASRGSSINYNIIDIAVDHILNGKRTALVAYTALSPGNSISASPSQ